MMSSPLFLRAFHLALVKGRLSQQKFAELCRAEVRALVQSGRIKPEYVRGFSQENISRMLSGQFEPSRLQVMIWVRVLHAWYSSPMYQDMCARHGHPPARFEQEDATLLMNLAGYLSETEHQEIVDTAQQRALLQAPPQRPGPGGGKPRREPPCCAREPQTDELQGGLPTWSGASPVRNSILAAR